MKDKLLRIKLHQNKANYKKEETVDNKMTYPLPPYSTIIGAIHNACNYKEYKDMDISIQGKFQSLGKEIYRDQAFLKNFNDDRYNLVKVRNPKILNDGYKLIGKAQKKINNSFKKRITVDILDEKEYEEFLRVCNLKDFYKEKTNQITSEILELKKTKKNLDKKSTEYINCEVIIKTLEDNLQNLKLEEKINYIVPYSCYKTVNTSIRYYEVLYDVDLVVHIRSSREVLDTVEKNITNLTSLGRSEDFVEIEEVKFVNIYEDNPNDIEFMYNSGFVPTDAIEQEAIVLKDIFNEITERIEARGTNYYINKNYEIQDGKRKFKKYRVGYLSEYEIDFDELKEYNKSTDKNIYLDEDGYIVSLV